MLIHSGCPMNSAQHAVFGSTSRTRNISPFVILFALLTISIAALPCASAQTFSLLHTFADQGDGGGPIVGLTLDRAGNLYGTAGIAFRMKNVNGSWTLTPLAQLPPFAGLLTFGPDGSLYVPTLNGGLYQNDCWESGCGTVVNLRPQATICAAILCNWNMAFLYEFTDGADGAHPNYTVTFDSAGNIFGTNGNKAWELARSGGGFSVLYNFGNQTPGLGGLVFDRAGNFYGTVWDPVQRKDLIYEMSNTGSGWSLNTLYTFQPGDGRYAEGGLIFDQAGNLYGATEDGGTRGGGTVYELSPSAGGWAFQVIYNLPRIFTNEFPGPTAALTFDAAGNLYGTTAGTGTHGYGSVFKLTHGQSGWTYTDLYDFTGGDDGLMYYSSVTPVIGSDGTIYGTAPLGGTQEAGTVWQITQP